MKRVLSALFVRPALELVAGLDSCLTRGARSLVLVMAGLLLGWWIYVPLHELLHAAACLAAGGQVSRLEIDPLYGGTLLAEIFPFVAAGSEYAGRLSGFDTGGDDLVYLATDFGPFLLTLFPGVWALRRAGSKRWAVLFGASIPWAFAPFVSATGDAYEIGSILVTRLPPWAGEAALLRGDDLLAKLGELSGQPGAPWGGAILAALAGLLWTFLTYAAGGWLATRLGQPPLSR
jgi:hypothetical protein